LLFAITLFVVAVHYCTAVAFAKTAKATTAQHSQTTTNKGCRYYQGENK